MQLRSPMQDEYMLRKIEWGQNISGGTYSGEHSVFN